MSSSTRNVIRHTPTRSSRGGISSNAASPIIGLVKGLMLLSAHLPRLIHALPATETHRKLTEQSHQAPHPSGSNYPINVKEKFPAQPVNEAEFWVNAGIAMALVIFGGLFAGLTLGLMGQDEIYLQVIEQSGEGAERIHAGRVLRLLKRGKHWVLVTLLLSNVITNETLPIVLDRSLGGGWPAVVSSTVLIVIFGEIIPQSVCVRYGLAIGSYLSPLVIGLMYLMYPVGKPTAMLLDWILGEDHGTVYKKAGLKTLVTLHKTLGSSPADRLNQDEVTIISAVLDLKDKPVVSIMTPIKDVFTMSIDDVLDEKAMDAILSAGYSRIPIHAPGEPTNFVGMLLVKILITYDPEDAVRIGDFPLATLPETAPDTSCLDIVNFFQEGKSHMVLVSSSPGENYGALGVVTLEDVIEELIGEEIIDESDVFIDVHKAIRRINPFPFSRRNFSHPPHARMTTDSAVAATQIATAVVGVDTPSATEYLRNNNDYLNHCGLSANTTSASNTNVPSSPLIAAIDSDANGTGDARRTSMHIPPDVITHLKHLGPSNLASNPKKTMSKTIKIKHGSVDDVVMKPSTRLNRSDSTASSKSMRPGPMGYGALISTGEGGMGDNTTDDPPPLITLTENPGDVHVVENHSHGHSRHGSNVEPSGNLDTVSVLKKVARSGSLVEKKKTSGGVPKTVIETTSSEEEDGANWGGSNGKGKENSKGERSPLLGGR